MLEASTLLVHPWLTNGSRCARAVADGTTSATLGRVRWVGPPAQAWFRWLRGHRLEVLETEDAALLMTVERPWGLTDRWDVCDADDRRIGTICPPVLLDNEGGRRAYLDRQDSQCGKVLDPSGRELAGYERRSDRGTFVHFASDLEPNPFLRMLVLGAVLVQEPPPGRLVYV
jgi:hypothetical protein